MDTGKIDTLIKELAIHFNEAENAEQAEQMAAYMKGLFPFKGIKAPQRTEIQKQWFPIFKAANVDFWQLMNALWELPEREYQFVGVDLMKKRPAKAFEIDDWKQLEYFITTKSWWDTVDLIASNYLGKYLQRFPEKREEVIHRWRNGDNMWLQRSCLLFQLKYKEKTDFELLTDLILQFKPNNEFFIQKAIGWTLRQHSKFHPEQVREFVASSGIEGLALREASKYL